MISTSSDLWIIPSPKQVDSFGDVMSLSPIEIDYCEFISALAPLPSNHTHLSVSLEMYSQSPWLDTLDSLDPLNELFPTDEGIVETMYVKDPPWDDSHHHSSFMLGLWAMSTSIQV